MSKEEEVNSAMDRTMDAIRVLEPAEEGLLKHEFGLMYDTGQHQGRLDTDMKLDEALKGLQRGNVLAERLKGERDAILEEYSRISWTKVLEGLLQTGYHPPGAHQNIQLARRIGAKPCPRCKPEMVMWDQLLPDEKKDRMGKVWAAVMKARAARIVGNVPIEQAPTTHELAGTGAPSKWMPLDVENLKQPQTKQCKNVHRRADMPDHIEVECKCNHMVPHCCKFHCCCFRDYPQVKEMETKT